MIAYNPKQFFKILFRLQNQDTLLRLTPLLCIIFAYSCGVAYLELTFFKIGENSWVQHIPVMHSLLSFVISLLLVFRTNTAYERWWEGRKHWGSLVNCSRNLALKLNAMLPLDDLENRFFFTKTISHYAVALKDHLRSEFTRLSLDSIEHPEFKSIDNNKHIPNQVASMMFSRVDQLYREGVITGDQFYILNDELTAFTDICGACERIKNTPIPLSYSSFIKKFIALYVISLPIGYVFNLGYYAAPIVTFVFYVLASLELIAEEIEDPFGVDENDLPMDKLAENIGIHVEELL